MDPTIVFSKIRELKLTQDELKKQKFEVVNKDIRVVVNGKLDVLEIEMPEGATPEVKKRLITVINKAVEKAQTHIMQAMQHIAQPAPLA